MSERLIQIATRLRKLILMLSSDQPGEVFSAARAIDRTLKEAGTDWHGLVGNLMTSPALPSSTPDQDESWYVMWLFCLERSHRLRSREMEFINSLSEWQGDLTEKQLHWLTAIHERLGARER
jgi:hypothetical protein